MRVIPILFQSAMVRAILREVREPGTGKTETRRVLKKAPTRFGTELVAPPFRGDGQDLHVQFREPNGYPLPSIPLKYQIGDLLYVREGFHLDGGEVAYMADHLGDPTGLGWRPSIHLPRAHSRLTLKTTAVRIERLHDISDADVLAEGAEKLNRSAFLGGGPLYAFEGGSAHDTPVGAYNALWREINGDASWVANPWVVVIEFLPMLINVDVALREAA